MRLRIHVAAIWRKRWVRLAALALAIPAVLLCFAASYYYVRFARLIDARLHGSARRVFPRVLPGRSSCAAASSCPTASSSIG